MRISQAPNYRAPDQQHEPGTLGGNTSRARSSNNAGWVVGTSNIPPGGGERRACLGTPATGLCDLNKLVADLPWGMFLNQGQSLNNRGQIAGYASQGKAFLLTPTAAVRDRLP